MWCPECEENVDRREVVENDHRCPMCGHMFKKKGRDDDYEDPYDGGGDFDDEY